MLDENLPPRQVFVRLNQHFDVKHIKHDLRLGGSSDLDVYNLAVKLGRIIITYNGKDFRPLVGTKQDSGVIDEPDLLPLYQLDNKLTAFLIKRTPKTLQGKVINFSKEI